MLEQYRGLRRENYILAFGRLVTGLGSMVWPMMTLILSQKMGVSAKGVSVLLAAAMVGMAPAVYLGGRISDKRDKKQTIVILDLLSTVAFVTCAFIPMSWISIGLMFFGSLCQNMENPAYNALTADLTVTEDRDRSYSLQYLCANLGLVMSPTLAGLLFKSHLWLVFLINGLSIFCSAVLIQFFVIDTVPSVETGAKAEYQKEKHNDNVVRVLKDNPLILLFIFRKKNGFLFVFLVSMAVTTAGELISSYIIEAVIGEQLWTYDMWKFNFQGRIALYSSLMFGGLSVLLVKAVHPLMRLFHRKAPKTSAVVGILCLLMMLADLVLTLKERSGR